MRLKRMRLLSEIGDSLYDGLLQSRD